jgi:hypothetical protein
LSYDFILSDPEKDRKKKETRRLVALTLAISLGLFVQPQISRRLFRWQTLTAARKLAILLNDTKMAAIKRKTPLEVRFEAPDSLVVEEISSCGPGAQRGSDTSTRAVFTMSQFGEGVQFLTAPEAKGIFGSTEIFLNRFCYDPRFGSSNAADGILRGVIFLTHSNIPKDVSSREAVVLLTVSGTSANFSIE